MDKDKMDMAFNWLISDWVTFQIQSVKSILQPDYE